MRHVTVRIVVCAAILLTSGLWGCYRQSVVGVSSTRTSDEAQETSGNNSQAAPKVQTQSVPGLASEDVQSIRPPTLEQGNREAGGGASGPNDTKQAQSSLGFSSEEIVKKDLPTNAASAEKDDQQESSRRPVPAHQVIETWRAQAEDYVKRLKILYPRDSDQYREAERRYIGAKVKFDAWLNRLRMDLSTDATQSARFKDLLEAAYTKYLLFKSYVESLFTNTKGAVADLQSPLDPKTLEDAATRLRQGYSTDQQNRDLIEAQVRQLQWKDFDQI
jgi:hypothetical protein